MGKEIKVTLENKLEEFLKGDVNSEVKYLKIETDKVKAMYSKKYEGSELYYVTWINK